MITKTQEKEDIDLDQAIDFNPYNTNVEEYKSPRILHRSPTSNEEDKEGQIDQPGKFSP